MGSLAQPTPSQAPLTIDAHAMALVSPIALLSTYLTTTPQPPSTYSQKAPPQTAQSLQPRRPCGRLPLEPNKIQVTTNSLTHSHGSSLVRIGRTTIACGVRAEILNVSDIPSYSVRDAVDKTVDEWEIAEADGKQKRAYEREFIEERERVIGDYNLLVPNLSLDTGCSPLHPANAPPGVEQMGVSQKVLGLLLRGGVVRVEDLEIYDEGVEEGLVVDGEDSMMVDEVEDGGKVVKAYYALYIDMVCLSHGGSSGAVFDAAWLAVMAALKTTKLPYAQWDRDEGRVVASSDMSRARTLSLRGMPVPLSFGVCALDQRVLEAARKRDGADGNTEEGVKQGKTQAVLLVDLEGIEEECCAETGSVVVDCSKPNGEPELLRVEKSGGGFVAVEELQEITKVAEMRSSEWKELMEGAS